MAISAQELNIILSARDKEFARAMTANQRRVERFSKQSAQNLSQTSKSFGMLGAAAKKVVPLLAGVIAVSTISRIIEGAVEIGNLARVAGVSAERFQELAFAGNAFGVGQEKMADILKDVNDKFGDYVQTGAGPLADFFENIAPKVGLTADAFANLSSDQKLGAYIKALESANLSQADMTFYMEAIASDSTLLIGAYQNNGAELDRLSQKIRNAGGLMSDELIQNAKEAKEEFNLVAQVMQAQLSIALQDLLPLLRDGATFVASLASNIGEAYLAIKDFFGEVNSQDALNALDSVDEKIKKITESALKQADKESRINELLIDRARIMERINQLRIKESEEAKKLALSKIPALPPRRTVTPIKGPPKAKKTATQAPEKTATQAPEKTAENLEAVKNEVVELDQVIESLNQNLIQAFENMLSGTMKVEDAFKQMAASIISDLLRIESQKLMQAGEGGLAGGLLGGLGQLLGGAGGFLSDLFGGSADALAGGSLGIAGHAQGGTIQSGQPSIVGEHGRELFVPSSAGRILSVPQTKDALGGGGGVTVQQTINVSTGVQQTVRAEIQSLMPQIASASTQAVLNARRRGGAFAGAFN
jgi:hypothetical protein